MKRHISLLAIVLFSFSLMAEEIPAGYYAAIQGKSDSILKSTLYQIIKGGDRYYYGKNEYHTSSNPPLWEVGDLKPSTWLAFPLTDMHPDGIVWDMYSNCVRYYPNEAGESGCSLNIEHCLPKSWWGTGAKTDTIYRDLFNLNPADQRANGLKNNYAPGHVTTGDKFDNGSLRMDSKNKSQYGYICWEPEAQYRGDFARTYFYMVTAYEAQTWASDYSAYVNGDSYLRFTPTIVQVLLDWHREDPVSDKEICRADQITNIQHNRNPFIDYPELVEYIWGNKKGQAVDLSTLTCAFATGACPDPIIPEPETQQYDTLINLSACTVTNIGKIAGASSVGVQTNAQSGSASCVMGNSSTDGEITFTGINLTDTAILAFRASPYNSATSMQLEIYLNDSSTPFQTISETVVKDTRNEVRYRITIPSNTTSIRILSVGGSTSKRACMQELYLLSPKAGTGLTMPEQEATVVRKEIRDGQIVIIRNSSIFTTLGQVIR